MDKLSFADLEYENKMRKTLGEKFLERIDALIPWPRLVTNLASAKAQLWMTFQMERNTMLIRQTIGKAFFVLLMTFSLHPASFAQHGRFMDDILDESGSGAGPGPFVMLIIIAFLIFLYSRNRRTK